MMGHNTAVVAEIAGTRHLVSLDKAHKLVVRPVGGAAAVMESRPVTAFSAAVDGKGRLHAVAWLLSRHLMYYTSADGGTFTRSTLLTADGSLRLRDLLIHAGDGVSIVYVAETEQADTLVCYRNDGEGWEGARLVEAERPTRLNALQFDGAPGAPGLIYGVKEGGRTSVLFRPLSGDDAPEAVASIAGGMSDFCSITAGGARQACWIVDGHFVVNGLRQTEEPWSRTWPCLRRADEGIHCLWLENGVVQGLVLAAQRALLRPSAVRDAVPCHLALPGETRRAFADAGSLTEVSPAPEVTDRAAGAGRAGSPHAARQAQGDITLTEVVRNQAIYITRMQESLSAMERTMLRMQSEVNRLSREMNAVIRAREATAPQPRVAMHLPLQERPAGEAGRGFPDTTASTEPPTEAEEAIPPVENDGATVEEGIAPAETDAARPVPEDAPAEAAAPEPEEACAAAGPDGPEEEAPAGEPDEPGEATGYCGA